MATKKTIPKMNSQNRVGLHTKNVTMDGYHYVHWGQGAVYNSNFKRFRLLSRAKHFAKRIAKNGKYTLLDD